MSRLVACPQCQTQTVYDVKNSHRPFCSQRCRLIDLGEWASEGYAIAQPVEEAHEWPEASVAYANDASGN